MEDRKPIKIGRNRWYYSPNVYINVCAGYYELIGSHGYIRSFNNLQEAINGHSFRLGSRTRTHNVGKC